MFEVSFQTRSTSRAELRARVYGDVVRMYEWVREERDITSTGLNLIEEIAREYTEDATHPLEVEILLTTIYATMVAEEKTAGTRLGAKIKRLGIHQVLVDTPQLPVEIAVEFSKNIPWHVIDEQCRQRGF